MSFLLHFSVSVLLLMPHCTLVCVAALKVILVSQFDIHVYFNLRSNTLGETLYAIHWHSQLVKY